jgi:hypothetical protein
MKLNTKPTISVTSKFSISAGDCESKKRSLGVVDVEDIASGLANNAVNYQNQDNFEKVETILELESSSSLDPHLDTIDGDEKLKQNVQKKVLPLSSHVPESELEFVEWINERKFLWKEARLAKKKEKDLSRTSRYNYSSIISAEGSAKKSIGVLDFFRNASLAATRGVWQIVELQETDSPGAFIAWVMTSPTQIQKLNISIQRTMYVNVQSCTKTETNKITADALYLV